VARRILRDEDAARDAVQEAFVAAHRNLERFAGDARLSTWLHRITVNAALMRLRTRGARPETSLDGLMPRFEPDGRHSVHPSSRPACPDELLCRKETRTRVREAIDRLPEAYRTVVLLRDIEELDTVSTAELLGVSTAAVKVRLHRARKALRTLLEHE
jgi:RNA polymerase sigma-70 factor (ECF subfamily)